jgi:hypothetical protein
VEVIFWIGLLPPTLLIGFIVLDPERKEIGRTYSATTSGGATPSRPAADPRASVLKVSVASVANLERPKETGKAR